MPDWRKLVSEHLASLALDPDEREEVVEELAAHLDEAFLSLRGRGFAERDAAKRCLSEVHDWGDLCRRIQTARRKENSMTNRVTQLWLPGLLTFTLSMGSLALVQIFGPKPWTTWGHPPISLFYIPWLFLLPLVGALGAYLSNRAGGSRRAIFCSSVFPILPFLVTILVAIPISLSLDHMVAHNIEPIAFLVFLFGWVFVPGVALLAGGLPVQFFVSRGVKSARVAN